MNPAKVYLVQTDTTAGFLSQNKEKLSLIKKRDKNKQFIISVDSFDTLKKFTRVPKTHKKLIRRASKTTFVYANNLAIRVVKDERHLEFLRKIKWSYSTSSNESGKRFDESFVKDNAEIILYTKYGFSENTPSVIIKCGKTAKERLR
ncbi:MAG: Sua5/YciO/YrdC/YwlC family protein [Sulfurospirillaceae bacterium]|nr:Sua5/YciO/YrdC/YwlC family protein [Sulfurospirillaceae bacterium]